ATANGRPASRNPSQPLPTSPRKILAGDQFRTRNAAVAATVSRATTAPPAAHDTKAIAPAVNIACPAASPSAPSMKLKKFVTPTSQSSASTIPAAPAGRSNGGASGQVSNPPYVHTTTT